MFGNNEAASWEERVFGAPTPGRQCGDCAACCTHLDVNDVDFIKAAGVTCKHCTGTGCAIYARRPAVCQVWYCGWRRMPSLPEGARPDKCGVMLMHHRQAPAPSLLQKVYIAAIALKSRDDFLSPAFQDTLRVLRQGKVPVWLVFGESMNLAHPTLDVALAVMGQQAAPTPEIAAEAASWKAIYEKL